MLIVKKIDGQWQRWDGVRTNTLHVNTVQQIRTYADGRQETAEVEVEPYTTEVQEDMAKVAALVAAGTWDADQLAARDLAVAAPFSLPNGKRPSGVARYEEQADGSVAEICDVEDIPPPPPPPTLEERLAASGVTLDEIAAAIAARRAHT
jgi:hypothetical protein